MTMEMRHSWVGLRRQNTSRGTVPAGQMFVQTLLPVGGSRPGPVIIMVHGGGGQGLDFCQTADGRPGWAHQFLSAGYTVHVVDRPGLGRAPNREDVGRVGAPCTYEDILSVLSRPTLDGRHGPMWPGRLEIGDPCLDALVAGLCPPAGALDEIHANFLECGASLVDQFDEVVLVTHSMGGPFGWLLAQLRPAAVKAIIAVEPVGPPFASIPGEIGSLSAGVAAVRVPAREAALAKGEPLFKAPTLVVTGDNHKRREQDKATVNHLRERGVPVHHLELREVGYPGHGHFMMLELGSEIIAGLLLNWLDSVLGTERR